MPKSFIGATVKFSITFMCVNRLNFCQTMPSLRRIKSMLQSGAVSSSPSIKIVPAFGVSSNSKQRRKTLLPQPDPPIIVMRSPASTVKSMPRRTSSLPKDFFSPRTSITLIDCAAFPSSGKFRRRGNLSPGKSACRPRL